MLRSTWTAHAQPNGSKCDVIVKSIEWEVEGNRAVTCKNGSKAQFPTSQPQAQRRASRRVSSCRSRMPQQGSAVPNRRTLRHPPPQLSPHVDRKTQNLIRIKCLSFRASETQQLRETGVTEIFWEPPASGAHSSEWARPEERAAAGDALRGRSSTGQYHRSPRGARTTCPASSPRTVTAAYGAKNPSKGSQAAGPPCNRNPGEAKNPPAGEVRKVLFKIVSRCFSANAVAINYNGIKEGRYKR